MDFGDNAFIISVVALLTGIVVGATEGGVEYTEVKTLIDYFLKHTPGFTVQGEEFDWFREWLFKIAKVYAIEDEKSMKSRIDEVIAELKEHSQAKSIKEISND